MRRGAKVYGALIKIEVTHRCSLACIHCSSLAGETNVMQIGLDDCKRILCEASSLGVKEVAFSGGEPLLWPHLSEVVTLSRGFDFHTSVYTAGFIDNYEDVIKDLKTGGVNRLIFSLYSSDPPVHDAITGVSGALAQTVLAIKEAICKELNVELHFVPMHPNFNDLEGVARLASRLGTMLSG